MGKRYEVRVTPYALGQMLEIRQYISMSLQAPATKRPGGVLRRAASLL